MVHRLRLQSVCSDAMVVACVVQTYASVVVVADADAAAWIAAVAVVANVMVSVATALGELLDLEFPCQACTDSTSQADSVAVRHTEVVFAAAAGQVES